MAASLGFCSFGIARSAPFVEERQRALDALAEGRMEGMPWYTEKRVMLSTDFGERYPWGRSFLALAWPYQMARAGGHETAAETGGTGAGGAPTGRIAAYVFCGQAGEMAEYHDLLAAKCREICAWLEERYPGVKHHVFVDHGWALDRAIAVRAGLGFSGKHAGLLTLENGSYVLLAEILLSLEFPATPPSLRSCGSCSACIPACPTGAIVGPGRIDARRCISYLTIEHKGAIPVGLRSAMGSWIFGCDLCQEACPVNRQLADPVTPSSHGRIAPDTRPLSGNVLLGDLVEFAAMDEDGFRRRFAGSPILRAGYDGFMRNVAIALGNSGSALAIPPLQVLASRVELPVVADSATWALGQIQLASSDAGERQESSSSG